MKNTLWLSVSMLCLSLCSYSQGSWKAVTNINPAFIPYNQYGVDVFFTNDSTGFIADGHQSIYKTTNKGESWDSIGAVIAVNGAFFLRSIEFVNDTIGFAGLIASAVTSNFGALYKTTDGGYTWTQLTNMQMTPTDGICGIEHYGNRLVAVGTYSSPAWFYRSDDYGLSWTKTDLSALASSMVDCYMINKDTILISGSTDTLGMYSPVILKSYDGGLTWNRVFTALSSGWCWKMFFRNNGKGIASIQGLVYDSIKVALTNDYGETWQEVFVAKTANHNYETGGVCFLNDSIGWASSEYEGTTYETRDGGYTWDSIPLIDGVNRFVVLDSSIVIAPGNSASSVVYKYDNSTVGIAPAFSNKKYTAHSLSVFPNPAKNMLNIDITVGRNTQGIVRITDLRGVVVKEITKQFFKAGKTSLQQKIKLPAGIYHVQLFTNDRFLNETFEVMP